MSNDLVSVALIDDDKDDHLLIEDLLSSIPGSKYDLHWFSDSQTGLQALKNHLYDIYLVDYRLDAKTGLDLLDEMQNQEIKKSIILLTGKASREIDVAAMNKGASDFLPKDQMTSESLERSIRYCIKRAHDQEKIKDAEKAKFEKEASDQANRAKSLFLANMSHEIRTPLGAILGFADLALEANVTEKEKEDFLKTIKRNGDHLLELINDLLDLSKVEAGQLQLEHTFFNWREIVTDTIETLSPKTRGKAMKVCFDTDSTMPALLKGDSQRLRQIIMNMLSNAIKFTEKGSITISCSSEENEGKFNIVFKVLDTGIGLSVEDQKKLFQPFQQANSSLCRRYGGTGLGLDLSRKLARAQGGDLFLVSSSLGLGSVFHLVLPAEFGEGNIVEDCPIIINTKSSVSKGSKTSILLVEDTIENQTIVKCYLKDFNYEIDFANDGVEGIKKALIKKYDLILMDIQMPLLDGVEATRILREAGSETPIVALTAHALKEDREKALLSGFTEYITKPINKINFRETIERICKKSTVKQDCGQFRIDANAISRLSDIQH